MGFVNKKVEFCCKVTNINMVIGTGMIASAFIAYKENNNYVIFASGVSNSTSINQIEFDREAKLLNNTIFENLDKKLIYFSTCSIYDDSMSASPYVLHKLKMEELITKNHPNFTIFRVSNPIGVTQNKSTFLNYFIEKIKDGTHFEVWANSYRNIIDIDDMQLACSYIIENDLQINKIVNIAYPLNYSTQLIIINIENHFNKKGNYSITNKGSEPKINLDISKEVLGLLNINYNDKYLNVLLSKYFPVP